MQLLKPLITSKKVATVAVVVSLLPTTHFSVACAARGLTVTEPTTPASVLRVVAAVATRVRSFKLSKTLMIVTICFKFGGSRGTQRIQASLVPWAQRLSDG